ncbi:MAG: hypothetical protein CM15mP121_1130 [Bacteroidota bacterium]|nr:MAG: hypothetical protein CM15mP121_1130 [Bacteroidota bacterium]
MQAQFNIEHSVFFDTDKYTLSKTEKTRLQQFLADVEKEGVIQIEIFGYCDDRGTSNYNLNLSQNRANQIKRFLSLILFFQKNNNC